MNIEQLINTDLYLKRFKIGYEQTLFAPVWENLKDNRCILCGSKLKFPYLKKIAMCNNKKHGKSFIIKIETLNKLINKEHEKIQI